MTWHKELEKWNKEIGSTISSAKNQGLLIAAIIIPLKMREDWIAFMWRLNGIYPRTFMGHVIYYAEIDKPVVAIEDPSK